MYKFPKKTKMLCFGLMLIGLISLAYGFFQSMQDQYTDLEIRAEVKSMYYEHQSKENSQSDKHLNSQKDYPHKEPHGSHQEKHDYHYADLFSKIEKKFNCHLDYDQKKNAHGLDDIIYITQHYFHVKKQRPWSSLFLSNLFFLMISLGALVWLAVQYISQSGWSVYLLRIPQAVSSFLPFGGAIMLFIIITNMYHQTHN